jgi:hypothetical protein
MSPSCLSLVAFASILFSNHIAATTYIQSRQCWHHFNPLATINYQSSVDGISEIIEELGHAADPNVDVEVPINVANLRTEHGIWSYLPVCTDVLQSIGSKLCVYTSTSFSKGRGISIFTTPKIAKDFSTLPPFQDSKALEDQDINTFSGTWYTEELPGKGMGMLARKDLDVKTRVTAYTPALLAYLEDELPTMEREKYFRIAVQQLPEKTRRMYEGLVTVYGYPQIKYQDVVKANTFQMEVGGQNHLAIFPETSRLNHACAPKYVPPFMLHIYFRECVADGKCSAQYYLDPQLLTHFVHITRPVATGEEITISCKSLFRYSSGGFNRLIQKRHLPPRTHLNPPPPPLPSLPLHMHLPALRLLHHHRRHPRHHPGPPVLSQCMV